MSPDPNGQEKGDSNYMGQGIAIGLAIGAGLGVAFGLALDNMAFMSIGIGAGVAIGVAIGAGLQQRHEQDQAN